MLVNRTFKMFGEEAELRFMLKAFEQGIRVTKPFGDSMPYDFIADGGCRGCPRSTLVCNVDLGTM